MMIPRWRVPTFGLLDDGLTLRATGEIGHVWAAVLGLASSGRFMPGYWFFYAAVRAVVGASPMGFFVVNGVVLSGIAVGLAACMLRAGAGQLAALAAPVFLILSGPAAESFYTLSKAEPPLLLWLMTSLLLMSVWAGASTVSIKTLSGLGMLMTLLMADTTKETGLAMVPIALAWVGLAWWPRHRTGDDRRFLARGVYSLAAVTAAAAFLALRAWAVGLRLTDGWYTARYRVASETLIRGLTYWAGLLPWDFAYMLPLAVFVVLTPGATRRRPLGLVSEAIAWMIGWLVVYLPWGWAVDYYLLPFTLGCAIVGAVVLGDVVDAARTGRGPLRSAAIVTLAVVAALWVLTLRTPVTNASAQLVVDAANADVMKVLATLPPDSIVIVNIAPRHEYLHELLLHLTGLHGRPDVTVEAFSLDTPLGARSAPVYLMTPEMVGAPYPSLRLPFDEARVRAWTQRLPSRALERSDLVYETRHRVRLLDVGFNPRRLLEPREFSYGWKLYRLRAGA